jgi:hypothetical protein
MPNPHYRAALAFVCLLTACLLLTTVSMIGGLWYQEYRLAHPQGCECPDGLYWNGYSTDKAACVSRDGTVSWTQPEFIACMRQDPGYERWWAPPATDTRKEHITHPQGPECNDKLYWNGRTDNAASLACITTEGIVRWEWNGYERLQITPFTDTRKEPTLELRAVAPTGRVSVPETWHQQGEQ